MSSNKPVRSRKKKGGTPAPDEPSEKASLNTKGLFTKDLTTMMYGFGDDQTPYKESVELVEEIMVDYVVQTMEKAIDSATSRGGKPTTEDLIFLVRKDPKKFARVRELLHLQQEIAAARKIYTNHSTFIDNPVSLLGMMHLPEFAVVMPESTCDTRGDQQVNAESESLDVVLTGWSPSSYTQ